VAHCRRCAGGGAVDIVIGSNAASPSSSWGGGGVAVVVLVGSGVGNCRHRLPDDGGSSTVGVLLGCDDWGGHRPETKCASVVSGRR